MNVCFRCLSLNKSQYIIVWKERRFTYTVLASLLDLAEALVSRSEIDNWRQLLLKMPVSKNKILVKASASADFLLSMLFIAVLKVSRLRNFQHHNRNNWLVYYFSTCHIVLLYMTSAEKKNSMKKWFCNVLNWMYVCSFLCVCTLSSEYNFS